MKPASSLGPLFDTPPDPAKRRRTRMTDASLHALDTLGSESETKQARILAAIRAAGALGLTRQEIDAQLRYGINVICGRVHHLIHELKLVFEPLVGAGTPIVDAQGRPKKKSRHVLRDGRTILVAIEYLNHYPASRAERAA